MSQIITFKDAELAKLAPFYLAIYKKLPFRKSRIPYEVLDDIYLESYKIKFENLYNINLTEEDTALKGQTAERDFTDVEGE